MAREIAAVLEGKVHSIWLYGSTVMDDFRLGWSDIDFIAFAEEPLTEAQAEALLTLRQSLSARYPQNPYFRCFEGVIVSLEEYRRGEYTRLVYWGTSGQRITNRCDLDVFARYELAVCGVSVYGQGDRSIFPIPERAELNAAVRRHYESIRRYAVATSDSLYSCGWLLDIARCIYTLQFCEVTSKTHAGKWALDEHLFGEEEALRQTLRIRQAPLQYRDREDVKRWLSGLGPTVQAYADVLETELLRNEA